MKLESFVRGGGAMVAGIVLASCGARTGLLVEELPPPDGGGVTCSETPIGVTAPIPNLYFVLDTSTSMNEQSKWSNVRSAIALMIQEVGPRARFGVTVFPTVGVDHCAAGHEVMSLRLGDDSGAAVAAFLAATDFTPSGGTPTAPTLEAIAPLLQTFSGVTYAILATDGGPNCNASLTCDVEQCTMNIESQSPCVSGGPTNCCDGNALGCLDGVKTVEAVSDLRAIGVRTFVVGIPGSAPYADVLDNAAAAGGTARSSEPYYYSVDTSDRSQLESAIASVSLETLSCAFTLARAPSNPAEVNVYVGGSVLPLDEGSGSDGWTLQGTTLTLLGSTCQRLEAQPNTQVAVVEGCPTVIVTP